MIGQTHRLISWQLVKPAAARATVLMGLCITRLFPETNPNKLKCACRLDKHTSVSSRRKCRNEANLTKLLHLQGRLDRRQLASMSIPDICEEASSILLAESSVLRLQGNFIIVGDLHGQLGGLQYILERFGHPPATKYIFLGDYVDRGEQSLETLLLLLLLKVNHPEHIYLLRGNHESEDINENYGFAEECRLRLSPNIWNCFWTVYDALPLAAIVNNSAFCVHGGIGPHMNRIDEMEIIQRPLKIRPKTPVFDMLWSDPASPETEDCHWTTGERGTIVAYGKLALVDFLEQANLKILIRSHQYVKYGYEWRFDGKLLTIYSTPAYDEDGLPAVVRLTEENGVEIEQFHVVNKKK